MKILLLKMKSEADEIIPPIGLGYLAARVRKSHDVEILDCLKDNIEVPALMEIIRQKKYGMVGMLFFTMNYKEVLRAAKAIKQFDRRTRIVVGGPHPSARPEETLREIPEIDFLFAGEAETGFPMLVELLEKKQGEKKLGSIPNLVWRKKNKVMLNKKETVCELDKLGFPAWDLLMPEKYPQAPYGSFCRQFPAAPIIITRGCPYNCTFCGGHIISGKKLRARSVNHVIEEIRLLVKNHGIREIHIVDDNFTFNREYVEEFCNKLIGENLSITFTCPNGMRLDTLDREILLLMKKAGLYSVSIGIESGSDRILKMVKKSLNTAMIREKVEMIDNVGLNTIGFVMLGFPTETREEIEKTIEFVCSLPLKRIALSCLQPLPGTEIYFDLMKKKEISETEWNKFFLINPTYAPSGISITELKKLRRRGLRKFYLRPKIIFSMLSEIKSPEHLYFVAKRAMRWLV